MTADVYTRITNQIVAELEKGTRPWMKPWDAAHVAGPVSRPLRGNGQPYAGINVLMLWLAAMERSDVRHGAQGRHRQGDDFACAARNLCQGER
jgi:antirestriction protein ArdC